MNDGSLDHRLGGPAGSGCTFAGGFFGQTYTECSGTSEQRHNCAIDTELRAPSKSRAPPSAFGTFPRCAGEGTAFAFPLRRAGQDCVFRSERVPRHVLKAASVEAWLYLYGVGDRMGEALSALLGDKAKGLSASTIGRLKAEWADELKAFVGEIPTCR